MSEALTSIELQIKEAAGRLRRLQAERDRQAKRRIRRLTEGIVSTPGSEREAEIGDVLLDKLAAGFFAADAELRLLEAQRAAIVMNDFDALFEAQTGTDKE